MKPEVQAGVLGENEQEFKENSEASNAMTPQTQDARLPRSGKIVHRWKTLWPVQEMKVTELGIVWSEFDGKILWSATGTEPPDQNTLIFVDLDELRIVEGKSVQ